MSHLNHLQVVANTASAGVNAASSLLSKGKDYVPKSAAPVVAALEERASPLLAFAADTAGGALVSVDKKVTAVVDVASKLYASSSKELGEQVAKQKAFHETNLAHYKSAREAYLRKIEEAVDYLKTAGVTGAARAAADAVTARVDDAKKAASTAGAHLQAGAATALDRVGDAWTALLAQPAVQSALAKAAPSVAAAKDALAAAHAAVASSPAYAKVYGSGVGAIAAVQGSAAYKAAAARFGPAVAPIAGPAVAAVTGSPYYAAAVENLRPIASK